MPQQRPPMNITAKEIISRLGLDADCQLVVGVPSDGNIAPMVVEQVTVHFPPPPPPGSYKCQCAIEHWQDVNPGKICLICDGMQ